ncbi:MAG: CoxG family protein [Actinomycetota bacterium]
MIITESFILQAERDRVAALLADIERVAGCVPGVENVAMTEPDTYQAVLRVQIGPIVSSFKGSVEVDRSEAPARLAAKAEGKDRSTQSMAKVGFSAALEEIGDGTTRVDAEADVSIRGRLGQFGTGVIQATATQMLNDFATCVNAALGTAEEEGAEPAPAPERTLRVGRVVAQSLWARLTAFLRSLRRNPRRDDPGGT